MRHSRSAKQRLWLGPGGHCGRCGLAVTNGNADSYAHRNSYAFGMRGDNITYTNGDSDSHCHGNSYSYGHAYLDTQTYGYAAPSAVTAASSDGSTAPDLITPANPSVIRSPPAVAGNPLFKSGF